MFLVIGNKNYSSWSLRPWLLLTQNGIPFDEKRVRLSTEQTASDIAQYSAAGKVPVLHDGNLVVWDSLAICEYVSERYLDGRGWPERHRGRAVARSCSAEMHSGFFTIREELPMNCRATGRSVGMTAALQKEISRVDALWSEMLTTYGGGGGYLFDEFSIADCMFAPVVFRFRTYGIEVSERSEEYMRHMLMNSNMRHWLEAGEAEVERIEAGERGE